MSGLSSCHLAASTLFLQITSRWGTEDGNAEGQRNNILQKAITLYVGQLGLKYDSALVVLSSVKEKGSRDEDSYNMVHTTCCTHAPGVGWSTINEERGS